jgi:hypothetical protein
MGPIDVSGALLTTKVHVDAFIDTCPNPPLVAENRQHASNVRQFTTSSDVAVFVGDHLRETLQRAGLNTVDATGDISISGEVRQFFDHYSFLPTLGAQDLYLFNEGNEHRIYEKLGAHIESTSVGRHAEIESPVRPYSPEEVKKLDEQLQAFYDQFVEKVAASRHTTPARIDAVAQGRVWTGRQAKQIGLVDELGGLDRAIVVAKQRAKIPVDSEVELVNYPPRRSFFEIVTDQFTMSDDSSYLTALLPVGDHRALSVLTAPLRLFRRGEPLAIMPVGFLR